jgi:hypothetical protein
MQQHGHRKEQEAAVRRVVGIAALRRLRKMADADKVDAEAKKRRAHILLTAILIIAAVGLGFLLQHAIFG